MSNARISEQILTRLLCKRMGAALVGNTRLGTIDLGDNPQLQVRAQIFSEAACSAALVSFDSFCGLGESVDRPTDPQTSECCVSGCVVSGRRRCVPRGGPAAEWRDAGLDEEHRHQRADAVEDPPLLRGECAAQAGGGRSDALGAALVRYADT